MRDAEPGTAGGPMGGLRELERAATPGPWRVDDFESRGQWIRSEYSVPVDIASVQRTKEAPNAALIVALRNAAPALLDLVDACETLMRHYPIAAVTEEPMRAVRAALDRLPR